MTKIILHELRLILREPRFLIPFLLPPLFLVIMQVVFYSQYGGAGQPIEAGLLLIVGVLLSTMSVTLTSDSFAGERERNTLELLLCLPLGVRRLFFGKLLALLPFPLLISMSSQAILWAIAGHLPWIILVESWLYTIAVGLIVTGVSLVVSLFSKSARSAAQANVVFVLLCLGVTQAIGPSYFQTPLIPWLMVPVALIGFGAMILFALRRFEKIS